MSNSITKWISAVKKQDIHATEQLWNEYYSHLVKVARGNFKSYPKGAYDEDDAATSALVTFLKRAGQGEFPLVRERDGLWKLLTTITIRKVTHRLRRKPLDAIHGETPHKEVEQPELVVEARDSIDYLFEILGDDELRQTALLRLEGYSNKECAEALECSVKSIERRLRLVRATWRKEDERRKRSEDADHPEPPADQ